MVSEELFHRIRERAYDPPRRRDWVRLPSGSHAYRVVRGGSSEAVAFFRGAPHEPPCPVLAKEELTVIQTRLKIRIPVLLRRLYTEVADGGFGPEDGLLGLGEHGHRDEFPGYNAAGWYQAIFHGDRRGIEGYGVPLVGMTSMGWSTGMWITSVAEAGNPVRWWDPSLWRRAIHPRRGGFLATVPTLNEWWEHWLAGSDRLQELIDQAESDAQIR